MARGHPALRRGGGLDVGARAGLVGVVEMMRFFVVLGALLRANLMTAMQYRGSFLAEWLVGGLSAAGLVLPLFLVYARVPQVAGWTFDEALLVTGFFMLYNAFVAGLIEPNLGAVVEGVRTGSLDYMLIRPVDVQLLVSFRKVSPSAVWELVAGLLIVWIAAERIPSISSGAILVAGCLLLAGLFATYGLWLLVTCLSFWFVRVDNLRYLLGAITDAGRWPVTVYAGWLRIVLVTVIPVALISSYPAMALLGRLDVGTATQAVVTAFGMLALSRFVLLRSLSKYSSASS